LVVVQFGVSTVLVVGTVVALSQMRYLGSQELGFDKEHLVILPLNDPILRERYAAMEEALRRSPAVAATAATSQIPGHLGWTSQFHAEGLAEADEFLVKGMPAEAAIVDALGVELVAGSGFGATPPAPDSGAFRFVLNEAAVRRLGWTPEEALGRRVAVDVRW